MKKTRTKLGLITALTLIASAAANGSILYNNIPDLNTVVDPGIPGVIPPLTAKDYIDSYGGRIFNNSSAGFAAALFTTAGSIDCASGCTLGNITLNISSVGPGRSAVAGTNGFHLDVYSNASTNLTNLATDPIISDTIGTLITSLTNPANFDPVANNSVFTPNGTINLAANTKYWVRFSADSTVPDGVSANWNALASDDSMLQPLVNAGQPDLFIYRASSGAPIYNDFFPNSITNDQLLMKVEASSLAAVPVPGAAWLMGSALLGLMRPWRRKGGH